VNGPYPHATITRRQTAWRKMREREHVVANRWNSTLQEEPQYIIDYLSALLRPKKNFRRLIQSPLLLRVGRVKAL
jgi:hypothetical protein